MFELTLDKAKDLVLKTIEEKGEDYVYERFEGADTCSYVHGDVPGCLVGHVLFAAGVSLEWMSEHEGAAADNIIRRAVSDQLISADDDTRRFLTGVQEYQDAQETWGDSYRHAIAWV